MLRSLPFLLFVLHIMGTVNAQFSIDLDTIRFQRNHLKEIRGTSVHWSDDGDGFRMSQTTQHRTFNDTLVQSFQYNVLRVPGAWLARFFDWRSAVGSAYGMQRNYAGKPESVKTGLKELKHFAQKNNFRIMYTVNIDDPPEKIIELINVWNSLPPVSGPEIEWIELGNENYDQDPGVDGAQAYTRKVLPIIHAVRSVSTTISIGAIFANPVRPIWDTTVFSLLKNEVDFFIWHRYGPYTDYDAPDSYSSAVQGFGSIDRDLRQLQTMMSGMNIPLLITEYNLSFYGPGKRHQSMPMEPRYYFLTANFITAALRNNVQGLVKHQLANAGWHVFADIDFMGREKGVNSIGGMVSRQLNLWLERQDSLSLHSIAGYTPWECSMIIGKNGDGVDFIIQNHTRDTLRFEQSNINGLTLRSYLSYYQKGKELATERMRYSGERFPGTIFPFSIGFYRCSQ